MILIHIICDSCDTTQAWHVITMQTVEIECYKYWSEKNKFISISTSTVNPTVNEYMVVTVRTNFFIDEIDYLVSPVYFVFVLNYLP